MILKNLAILLSLLIIFSCVPQEVPTESSSQNAVKTSNSGEGTFVRTQRPMLQSASSTENTISITLRPVLNVTSYVFILHKQNNGISEFVSSIEKPLPGHTFTNLSSNTLYKVTFLARAKGVEESLPVYYEIKTLIQKVSSGEQASPVIIPVILEAPSFLSVSPGTNSVDIKISPVINATNYVYEVLTKASSGLFNLLHSKPSNQLRENFSGLSSNQEYQIRVIAKANGFKDSPSTTKYFKTLQGVVEPSPSVSSGSLKKPELVIATSTLDSIYIKINPVLGASSYVYHLYELNNGAADFIHAVEHNRLEHKFNKYDGRLPIENNRNFKFIIRARVSAGNSSGETLSEFQIATSTTGMTIGSSAIATAPAPTPTPTPAPTPAPAPIPPSEITGTNGSFLTLEQFGGQAYYKRFDDKLKYTPQGNGTTLVTYEGIEDVFSSQDLGMSFVGLFTHKNPSVPNSICSDEYYPGLLGSRYTKVSKVLNGKNIEVNFEFNGGTSTPQILYNQKGYIFFDNSQAYAEMMKSFLSPINNEEEIRFRPYVKNGFLTTTYVIPHFGKYVVPDKNIKLWTASNQKARLKIGREDYFKWASGQICYQQAGTLFNLNKWNKNFVIHNIDILPPHRRVVETEVARSSFFTNDPYTDGQNRIIAVINNKGLVEQREIGSKVTFERFFTMGIGTLYGRGSYLGDGVLRDVSNYFYLFLKDTEHSGGGYLEYKTPGGASAFLVAENLELSFDDPLQKATFKTKVRFTSDKTGFPEKIQRGSHYNEYVAQIMDPSTPFQLLSNWSKADGSSHNRAEILHIDRFTFMLPKRTYWGTVHDTIFSEGSLLKHDWNYSNGKMDEMTGDKHLLFVIPRKGSRYFISRDYRISDYNYSISGPNRKFPVLYTPAANRVRSFINYSVVRNKVLEDIDPRSIPANAKPIEFQPGDQFKIVGRGDTTYTILEKNRTEVEDGWAWEIASRQPTFYGYTYGLLDKNLPADLPLDFEIEFVNSSAEYLLDGQVREAYIAFKANGHFRTNQSTKFGDWQVTSSEPVGHNFYNHREMSLWLKNVHSRSGFYRDSSNELDSKQALYTIPDPDSGMSLKVPSRSAFSKHGYVLINSSGFKDQFLSVGDKTFSFRDKIERSSGIKLTEQQKAKLRLFNSPNNNKSPGVYLEEHSTVEDAPPMPAACRSLLDSLVN